MFGIADVLVCDVGCANIKALCCVWQNALEYCMGMFADGFAPVAIWPVQVYAALGAFLFDVAFGGCCAIKRASCNAWVRKQVCGPA